ncbi:uncharacterized protein BT62DRAFT_927581 [Guyanagaster necrorhizus]|uniref:SAGA-associated factor 11 n=1 Tax=Guyanagaster necrorhizus TaxID=856835 RepID=A0A9P7W2R3_9AGAR|nr:uncharacterized protein BT62DRAFT_927581 [Guyanagaster necrorhizus MCA 3950]KAG7450266.1 hypothetical protein BT62DRAFT_927581 [Guyanagaster necrorhizus MCA 3950]
MSRRVEKEALLASLTNKLFCAMLDEIVMDAAIEAHHDVLKSRSICSVCNTRCNAVHLPGSTTSSSQTVPSTRPGTPASADNKQAAHRTGTNTPNGAKLDGSNVYLDCVQCSHPIASNRYAPHLATCMGLSTARRSAARTNSKPKQSSDPGRSASPPTDDGNVSEDSRPLKSKSKSKSKRADEAEFNLKRKRDSLKTSPQVSPNKKQKQQKGSPVSRVKAEHDGMLSMPALPSTNSHSMVPSKLRDSSTASFLDRSSPSSRASSPDVGSIRTTVSSSFSGHSPTFASRGSNAKIVKGKGPPRPISKRMSPPRPPPPSLLPDYVQDDAGDETGSSTDTDSS